MEPKSKVVALLLAIFLGGLGIHKFYLKEKGAIWYLLFFWTGIPAILAIIDIIKYVTMSDADFQSKYSS